MPSSTWTAFAIRHELILALAGYTGISSVAYSAASSWLRSPSLAAAGSISKSGCTSWRRLRNEDTSPANNPSVPGCSSRSQYAGLWKNVSTSRALPSVTTTSARSRPLLIRCLVADDTRAMTVT